MIVGKKSEVGVMQAMLRQILVLYLFIFVGWLLGKRNKEQAARSNLISFLLVNVFLPCKVFGSFAADFTPSYIRENYVTVLISFGILLLFVALGRYLVPLFVKDTHQQRVYRYSLAISNYAYLGYVLAEAVFGAVGLANMILFCIPCAFYAYTFGFALITGKEGNLLSKLFNTMTVAIFLGMAVGLFGIPVPAVIATAVGAAGACAGPMSMLVTGLVLSTFPVRRLLPDVPTVVFSLVRLVLCPLAVFGVCKMLALFLTLPDAVWPFAVLTACMPCGLSSVVFPRLVGEDCEMPAKQVLLTHLLSIGTIPLWMSVLT